MLPSSSAFSQALPLHEPQIAEGRPGIVCCGAGDVLHRENTRFEPRTRVHVDGADALLAQEVADLHQRALVGNVDVDGEMSVHQPQLVFEALQMGAQRDTASGASTWIPGNRDNRHICCSGLLQSVCCRKDLQVLCRSQLQESGCRAHCTRAAQAVCRSLPLPRLPRQRAPAAKGMAGPGVFVLAVANLLPHAEHPARLPN